MYLNMDTPCLILLLGLSAGFVSAERPTTCPDGYGTVDNMCYGVFSLNVTWADAQSLCVTFGGDVLRIMNDVQDQKVSSYLQQHVGSGPDYWLDANSLLSATTWRFSGRKGERLTYFNWANGEPVSPNHSSGNAHNCAYLSVSAGNWATTWCTNSRNVVCEIELASPDIVG